MENPQSSVVIEHSQSDKIDLSGESIRFRAVVLGLILAVAVCMVTPFNNVYRQATPLGGGHFPLAPFFVLFVLTVFIAVTKKAFHKSSLLTGKELLLVWIQMVLVSGIAYTGLVRTLFINLTAPYYFATVENRWADILQPIRPKAWYPDGQEAIAGMYNGLTGGRQMGWWEVIQNIPWLSWSLPILSWGIFVLLCYMVMI